MWKKIEFILLFSIGLCFHSIAQQEIDAFFDSRPSEDSLKVIPGMFTTYRQGEQIFWEIPDSARVRYVCNDNDIGIGWGEEKG